MTFNTHLKYAATILVILFSFFILKGCYEGKLADKDNEISLLQLDNQKITKELNLKGDSVTIQKPLAISDAKIIKKYTDSLFNLNKKHQKQVKAVTAFYEEKLRTNWKPIYIPYENKDTIPTYIPHTPDSLESFWTNYLQVPKKFRVDSVDYEIEGVVRKEGLEISNINFPDTFRIRVAEVDKGLFKKSEIQIQTVHSNSLIQATGAKSLIYKPKNKNKFLEGSIVLTIGVILGLLISK
jgi:hypothetical protein